MPKTGRGFFSVIVALAGAVVPGEAAEFSRAFSEYPANANPRALISGRDGYLYGTIAGFSAGRATGGQVFRVAPDDDFRLLHRFDVVRNANDTSPAGAFPTDLFLMARDGCLYGLAQEGGMFGQGVLYRLTPDGNYSVIAHLDPSQLPSGTLDGASFVSPCRGFLEGPDDAFYTCLSQNSQQGIVRIGRDGKISLIGHADANALVFTDPNQPRDLLCASATHLPDSIYVNQVKVTRFRVTGEDEGVVETITSPVFDRLFNDVWAMAWTPGGLMLRADFLNHPNYSSRVFLLKLDGSLETIADIGWTGSNGVLPYLDRFVHFTNDGTLYYYSQYFSQSGASLIERKADGSFRAVCGFASGELMQTIPTPAGDLCGASFSPRVYLPEDSNGFSPDWMADPSKHEIVHENLRGGLFFQVSLSNSPVVNSRPLAVPDVVKAKRSKSFIIRNLRNDWDPEGHELRINNVVEPDRGHFTYTSLQSLYQSQDEGLSSGFARYEVLDGTSAPSVGTILIQGNPSATYLDPALLIGRRAFMIDVKPDGTFTAGVPKANGNPVVMSGKMDWYNRGLAQILLHSGESIAFSVHLVTGQNQPAALDYRIRNSDGSEVTGRAAITR